MSKIEILYKQCLEQVAPIENARMREGMGFKPNKNMPHSLETKIALAFVQSNEATIADLATKIQATEKAVMECVKKMVLKKRVTKVSHDDFGNVHIYRFIN